MHYIEAGVIHHSENMSDHAPIYCSVEFDDGANPLEENQRSVPNQNPKPSWKKATKEQKESFPTILNEKLSTLAIPNEIINCRILNAASLSIVKKLMSLFVTGCHV